MLNNHSVSAQAEHCIVPTAKAESVTVGGRVKSGRSTPSTLPSAPVVHRQPERSRPRSSLGCRMPPDSSEVPIASGSESSLKEVV